MAEKAESLRELSASAGYPESQVLAQSPVMTQDIMAPLVGTERSSTVGSELFLSPLI